MAAMKKATKELCDVLAVFQNNIFIFSDKFCVWKGDIDKRIAWNRWYRHAVEAGAILSVFRLKRHYLS